MVTRLSGRDALIQLVDALPICCRCDAEVAVVQDANRFSLCERCWNEIPSRALPLHHDMRVAVRTALATIQACKEDTDDHYF